MTAEDRELIDEKFKSLITLVNAQFASTHDRLDRINGTVGKHEAQIQEALIERAKNREEQKHVIETHILSCPQAKIVQDMDKRMEDLSFFLRHPKLFIAGLVLIIILSLGTFLENNPFVKEIIQPPKTEIPE